MMSHSFARLAGRAAIATLAVITFGALAACGGDSTAAGTTKVSILLTDAPGDIKAAVPVCRSRTKLLQRHATQGCLGIRVPPFPSHDEKPGCSEG